MMVARYRDKVYQLNIYGDLRCLCGKLVYSGETVCDGCGREYILEPDTGYCFLCGKEMEYIINEDGLKECKECLSLLIERS